MYQKGKYVKEDPEYIFKFIQNHPFATFVLKGDRLLATHIPILPEGNEKQFRLFGHISNEYNVQVRHLKDGCEALLIFQGPHAYISSSWYKEKNISTWDYSAVHVNAYIKIQTGNELKDSLKKLIHQFEKDRETPLFYEDIPEKMIEDQIPHITGFWAEPFRVEAVAKLHQGYPEEDVNSTIAHLQQSDDPLTRRLAEKIRKEH